MRWTPWFTAHHYAYRQCGNGMFVELGRTEALDAYTVFLQGDEAGQFVDNIERLEANEDVTFRIGLENAIDYAISMYFP